MERGRIPLSSEQPDQKPRKPGFFSRLFEEKHVEPPPEDGPVASSPVAAPGIPPRDVSGPPGFDQLPGAESVPPVKKGGIFTRFFGGKERPPADAPVAPDAPTETSIALPAIPAKNWFERLRERLVRGSGSFISSIRAVVGLSGRLDEETTEKLEEILIASDVSMETAIKIVDKMKKRARAENIEGAEPIMTLFKEVLREVFVGSARTFEPKNADGGPYVVTVIGVNGVGKTTTIGKMAKRCRDAGLKTMLVAGDTFRAAAVEQLEIWAQRTGSDFVRGNAGADPSGLAFDALQTAKARGIDVVFIDTAGRLHNKASLMDELGKVARVMGKIIPGAPHETLLVLDATTGQNAVQQVKIFSQATPLTGLVMTKLDGTAKGGILITIRDQFDVPVTLIGVGEGIDDLRDFDPEQFTAALFAEG